MAHRKIKGWEVPQVTVKMKLVEALFQIENNNSPIIVFPVDGQHVDYTINENGEFTFTIKGKIETRLNFQSWYKENLLNL